jgi:LacI family transcriptional regulator
MVHPALTTVNQPLEKMGRVATQKLLDLLQKPDSEAERIELPTELIIRDSCCNAGVVDIVSPNKPSISIK